MFLTKYCTHNLWLEIEAFFFPRNTFTNTIFAHTYMFTYVCIYTLWFKIQNPLVNKPSKVQQM